MISGEYEIVKDKTEWSERTMEINLVLVTAEERVDDPPKIAGRYTVNT